MALQSIPYGLFDDDPDANHDLAIREAWKRQSEMNADLYALQSQIMSAGDVRFADQPTVEAKISAARAQAAAELKTIVVVPAIMLLGGYDATQVDFTNTAVRNVREGGDYTVYDVRAYGAYYDGIRDSTASWNAAVAAAGANQGTVVAPPGTDRISRVLVTQSDLHFVLTNAHLVRTSSGVFAEAMLDIRGSTGAGDTLSVTAALGTISITVTAGSTFTIGQFIEIESQAFINDATVHPYLYEINNITNIVGNVLTLRMATRNRYDITVATVNVRVVNLLSGIVVEGGDFTGPGGTVGDCVRLQRCFQPSLYGIDVSNFGDRGLILTRSFGGTIDQCLAHDGTDATNSWGISLESCERVEILGSIVYNHPWDGFDLSLGSMYNNLTDCHAFGVGDVGFVIGHGLHGHHNTLTSCIVARSGAAGFTIGNSTYAGDDDNVLQGCRAIGCGNHGFTLRQDSARNRFVGCTALACTGSGFNVIGSNVVDTVLEICASDSNTNFGYNISGTRTRFLNSRAVSNSSGNVSDTGTDTYRHGNRIGSAGTGPQSGRAVLSGGTVTVTTAEVVANDSIQLTRVVAGGTLGHLSIGTITAGTSFVINSSSGSDTSTIFWEIVH